MKSFKETIEPINENMSWKVEIEGLPHMYFNGRSAGAVKNELRKILKNPGDAIKSITRVTPTEIKKDFRLRLTDKNDLEGEPIDEAVDATDTGGAEEVSMVKNQMKQIRHYIDGIEKMVADDGDIEEWAQNKLTKATDYLKSVYGYKTGKVEESLEESMSRVAKDLEAYARKSGGIDKMDFMRAAMLMKRGNKSQLMKFVDDLDTEPREKILSMIDQDAKRRKEYNAFQKKKRMSESTDAYGKSIEKQHDDKKKAGMTDSDKAKMGAIAQMMAREKEKRQKQMAQKAREKGDFDSAHKHDQAAAKARR